MSLFRTVTPAAALAVTLAFSAPASAQSAADKADASVRMHEGETADRPFDVTIGSTGLWSVSAPDPNRPPRAVDLDGDGVSEIVFSHSGEDGRPSLGVIVIEERP